jgi:hypothetical protein
VGNVTSGREIARFGNVIWVECRSFCCHAPVFPIAGRQPALRYQRL